MRLALALAAVAVPCLANAADRPQFPPTGDVAAHYVVTTDDPRNPPLSVHAAFSARLQKLRVDGEPGALIADLGRRSMLIMITQVRVAMRMPINDQFYRAVTFGGDGAATRTGSDRIAGLDCTIWHYAGKEGSGSGCITDDGVPLSGQGSDTKGTTFSFKAVDVEHAPQPAPLFDVPPGFQTTDLPGGMPRPHR